MNRSQHVSMLGFTDNRLDFFRLTNSTSWADMRGPAFNLCRRIEILKHISDNNNISVHKQQTFAAS